MAGNKTLYIDLLHRFLINHANNAEEIKNALRENDSRRAKQIAHSVKGVSGNLGAEALSAAALKAAINDEANQEIEHAQGRFSETLKQPLVTLAEAKLPTLPPEDEETTP